MLQNASFTANIFSSEKSERRLKSQWLYRWQRTRNVVVYQVPEIRSFCIIILILIKDRKQNSYIRALWLNETIEMRIIHYETNSCLIFKERRQSFFLLWFLIHSHRRWPPSSVVSHLLPAVRETTVVGDVGHLCPEQQHL